ncbi:hypothetical protein VXE41_24335, partial [Acinetobacter variabilis]
FVTLSSVGAGAFGFFNDTATTEIYPAREQQLFNGKNFHVVIYNKTESVSGLHQHDYYEFTVVLTGRYYQEINGKRVL